MRHVLELHSNQIFVVSYLDIFGGGRGKKRIIRALYTQDIATLSNHAGNNEPPVTPNRGYKPHKNSTKQHFEQKSL